MPFSGGVSLNKDYHRSVSGTVSFSGALQESTAIVRLVEGVLSFTGNLTSVISTVNLFGILDFNGVVTLIKNGVPVALDTFIVELGKVGIQKIRRLIRAGK
jgi:hypothetical protein